MPLLVLENKIFVFLEIVKHILEFGENIAEV
jgi:hypothetical protein